MKFPLSSIQKDRTNSDIPMQTLVINPYNESICNEKEMMERERGRERENDYIAAMVNAERKISESA